MTAKALGATEKKVPAQGPRARPKRVCAAALLLLSVSCTTAPVLRVSGGKAFEERPISPTAYAAYARARLLEARGDLAAAAAQYKLVLAADPESTEAMVRLAVVYCMSSAEQSAALFSKAEQLDATSAKLWLERASCELRQGQFRAASDDAKRALSIEPALVPALTVVIAASSALNDADAGLVWLRAALAANPSDVRLWNALFEHKRAPRAEQLYAAAQLERLRPRDSSAIPPRRSSGLLHRGTQPDANTTLLEFALNHALDHGSVDSARNFATSLGLNPQQMAERALSRGAFSVAAAQSELLLAVNPENSAAWVVGLVAADQLMQSERVAMLLAHLPTQPLDTQSPLVNSLVELLKRRVRLDDSAGSVSRNWGLVGK